MSYQQDQYRTMRLGFSAAWLIFVLLSLVGCNATDPASDLSDGDRETSDTAETDEEADSDGDSESDIEGDSEIENDSEDCLEGSLVCEGSVLNTCINTSFLPVADCSSYGWICEAGACIAAGEETETERNYRTRLMELRLTNVRATIELDRFGGWINAPETMGSPDPGKFFRVKKLAGVWWFVTPDGHPFVSRGVTDVNFLGAALSDDSYHQIIVDKYGDEDTWGDTAEERLRDWAFNTIGPWSSFSMGARLPHATIILDSASHAPRYTPDDFVTDYWSAGFEQWSHQVAVDRATPYVNDENFIGYFLDNELFWGPDWRSDLTLLQVCLDFPTDAPGRTEALRFIREQAANLDDFNATWGTTLASWDDLNSLTSDDFNPETDAAQNVSDAFAIHAFQRYATIAIQGLRTVDPDHLILGCRFAWYPGDALILEAGQVFDVISLAGYHENWVDELDAIWPELDKPILIEEFSFKAKDSGLPNVMNYAIVVETQKDRALAYDEYVKSFIGRPYAVAYHWYKWFDNPPDGFIAGDNFGLMNYLDEPYTNFVTFIREVNIQVETWHAEGPSSNGNKDL